MSLPNPWIANLVKRCLASYLGHTQENDVEVEDDGACLSFGIHNSTFTALIADVCFPYVPKTVISWS